ncbi:hypothetical protein EVJ58_g8947 [Rhodofomes roseus]|uniref:PA domain-containing protein n=1 Tax=Rhodofomes roseus TaxID=34475 RepID=A0A4Y9XX87_9APHY|nr:hypothetical protein EVJ58_g8947 [Rhodofomes roseus]
MTLKTRGISLRTFRSTSTSPSVLLHPVFPPGSPFSRAATLGINQHHGPAAWIDKCQPVMNTPVNHSLSVLSEDGEAVSNDCEVDSEGELIHANYGRKEDYDDIVAAGGDLSGKIFLAQYGAVFRGLEMQPAQESGTAGVLIYSDTHDPGFVTAENAFEACLAGPRATRPLSSAPAYPDAERKQGANIPKIPSLPILWANAQTQHKNLGVSLDVARTVNGRSSVRKVKLVNHVINRVIPIYHTMAVIPGHIRSETVVLGCHRDACVFALSAEEIPSRRTRDSDVRRVDPCVALCRIPAVFCAVRQRWYHPTLHRNPTLDYLDPS